MVFLFVPNLIGYARLVILFLCFGPMDVGATTFVWMYALQMLLDGVDGIAARKLNQVSAFGAWLDVAVDNIGRTLLWSVVSPRVGPVIACLEWLTFVCTHAGGARWRTDFAAAPGWVQAIMRDGFKTPQGALVIGGIHALPLWLFVLAHNGPLPAWCHAVTLLGVAGRAMGSAVELWVIRRHILHLADQDKGS